MREITLTNGGAAIVDDGDYERIAAHKWQRHPAGYGYRCTRSRPAPAVVHMMHREIMDAPKHLDVDHVNGDGLDNRRENLRLCTPSQNLANRARQKNNVSSQFKGVSKTGRLWRARCQRVELGNYATEIEAAQAYNVAAQRVYGEFARLNDIQANR